MKRIIFLLVFVSLTSGLFAQFRSLKKRNHTVNKVLKKISASDNFKTAGFAFYAIDMNTGETIAELNPNMALKPASTLKLLSTATALELLGPEFQFETILEYSGVIDKKTHFLQGNLFIRGGGDPSLGSKYFDLTKDKQFLTDWALAIKEFGIDSISGRIIADARTYSWDIVPPTWSWINMGNYYGAGPCGLCIYDNYYSVYFNTGHIIGDTAEIVKVVPHIPGLKFDNTITADSISYDDAYIYGAPYSAIRYARGQLPIDKSSFLVKGSIPDPAFIAAIQLDSILKVNHINIQKQPSTIRILAQENEKDNKKRKPFYSTLSPQLYEIITQTNIHSINLFAEHCLIEAGIKLGAKAETTPAIDSLVSYWKINGMDTQGLSLFDGSGLSQYNAITPHQLVYLLSYMKTKSEHFDIFYKSFAIAGKTGTIKNMFINTSAEGKLRAKSGTLTRVKAYSGYVTSKSGREIAFSMVANNFSGKSQEASAQLEELMIALAELNN